MKRISCLFLAVLFVFLLAACGKDSTSITPEDTSATGEQLNSQPPTDGPTDPPTEPPTEPPAEPPIIYIIATKTCKLDGVVTDYEEYDREGRLIKEIEGAPGSHGGYTIEYTYDEKGNCIKKVYTENNFPSDYTYYTYDEKGNMVKKDVIHPNSELHFAYAYNDAGQLIKEWDAASNGATTTYEYNSQGLLVRKNIILYGANEPIDITEYTYDKNGNKIKEYTIYNGTPSTLFTWTYDENGNMTSKLMGIYENNGELFYKEALRRLYDEQGNLIGESYDPYTEEVTPHTKYIYNDAGQTLEQYYIDSDSSLTLALSYQYDENGLLISTAQYNQDGSVGSTSITARDEQGRVLTVTCQNSDGSTKVTEEHTYDENGNLLSSISYESNIKWEYSYFAIDNPNQ